MTRRCFASLAAAPFLHADSSQERGRKLVEDTVAALGGGAFRSMNNRLATGRAYSFYREQLSGLSIARIYTQYLPHPDGPPPGFFGIREKQVFGKKQDTSVLFREDQGFDVTFRGARPLPDTMVARFKDSTLHDFFYLLRQRLGEPGLSFESQGEEVRENQQVQILDVFDADQRNITVYISRSTHLPVSQKFYRQEPVTKDRLEEVTRWSKYRDIGGGVMWPLDIQRERDTEKVFELYAESVTLNNKFSESLFTLPSGIKILKKEDGR